MRRWLHIFSIVLIVVTAQAFAAARATEDPSGRMVLCVGTTIMVVLTDADGQPMQAPHLCPDATMLAPTQAASAALNAPETLSFAGVLPVPPMQARDFTLAYNPRGPPGVS
ncbi:MAG: hypothetical protein AAF218_07250 [Pseudomonadota bacterium]